MGSGGDEDPSPGRCEPSACPAPALLHRSRDLHQPMTWQVGPGRQNLSPRAKCPPPAGCPAGPHSPSGHPMAHGCLLCLPPHTGSGYLPGWALGLQETPPLLAPAPCSQAGSPCLKSHPLSPGWVPPGGHQPTPQPSCLGLHCRCWVMYGPLALPGDSGVDGRCRGGGLGARRERGGEEPGAGESCSQNTALLTAGRAGSSLLPAPTLLWPSGRPGAGTRGGGS